MKKLILMIFLLALFCGCGNNDSKKPQAGAPQSISKLDSVAVKSPSPISQQDSVEAIGTQILTHLKYKDYPQLIKYFSNDGVLFSPYGYIDTVKSKKLIAEDFLEAIDKDWILTWGSYDGTGDPIKLSVKNYLKRFVYNADYLNAEAVGYDKIMQKGNSLNNMGTIYPNHHFIDYYFSGFNQESNGTDWTSLRLVFNKVGNEFFLVSVIHDQWTI